MKEITRRLYTKPVMLAMAFFVAIALVVALSITRKSSAMSNSFPVPAGNDEFETAGDGSTFHDFGGSPVPAGFFGSGSLAYSSVVPLVGVPLSPLSNVDTVIQRHQSVAGPGGNTPLTMTGLSLKSINSITVNFNDGTTTWTESWNMRVGLSDFKSSTGSMTINSTTFDSTLKVWPKFTFTRVSDGLTKVLDTGSGSGFGGASTSDASVSSFDSATAIAPCTAVAIDDGTLNRDFNTAAATGCPPVTLSSTNSPWATGPNGGLTIPVPITEEERWARHRPGPKGTIKQAQVIGVAE